jgi:dephospho-CoA kinase
MIGLTGGIACGKSAVARLLQQANLRVIDADQVAREVVEPGTEGLQAVVDAFGQDILTDAGRLNRAKLGARVFGDEAQRRRLNAILHPRIGMQTARYVQRAREEGLRAVVYEAALLVENRLHEGFDLLIVVTADPAVQRARLMARDGFDEAQAQQRLDAQLPLSEKVAAADIVIDNSGSPDALAREVQAVLARLPAALWPDLPAAAALAALHPHTTETP